MQPDKELERLGELAAHPLAEILKCPPETGQLLNAAARCIDFEPGNIAFRQDDRCCGLYVVVSGQFQRRTERLKTRLMLGSARSGDLLELGAALGGGCHTYTLTALTASSILVLPMDALNQAFSGYPPIRMRLLEELAREVSRGYFASCRDRNRKLRTHGSAAAL